MMFYQYMGRGGNLQQCGTLGDTMTCKVDMGDAVQDERKLYPFEMLATDYNNWSVLYACMDMLGESMYGNWFGIYTRYNTPITEEHKQAAHAALRSRFPTIDLSNFAVFNTSQDGCQYEWSKLGIEANQ